MTENINDNSVPNSICAHKYCVTIFLFKLIITFAYAVIYVAEASRREPKISDPSRQ